MTIIFTPVLFAGVWTDSFDKSSLAKKWKFHDRRDEATKTDVKGRDFHMTNPTGNWGT